MLCSRVPGIDLNASQVIQVGECSLIIAKDVINFLVRTLRMNRNTLYPGRSFISGIFMKETFVGNSIWISLQRLWAILQVRQNIFSHVGVVCNEITFGNVSV